MAKNRLAQGELKELFHYNPCTGIFIRKVNMGGNTTVGELVGTKTVQGYLVCQIKGDHYPMHRLAWLYVNGYLPENDIDHINRIKTDNRIINLRHVSRQCNVRNKSIGKNNKSGIIGVHWYSRDGKWQAEMKVGSGKASLGRFDCLEDAANARWKAEKKHGYPSCNTTSTSFLYLKERGLV